MNKIEFKTIMDVIGLKPNYDIENSKEEYKCGNFKLQYDGFYYAVVEGNFSKKLLENICSYKHMYNILWEELYPNQDEVLKVRVSTNDGLVFLLKELQAFKVIDCEANIVGDVNKKLIDLAELNITSAKWLEKFGAKDIVSLKLKEKDNIIRNLLDKFEILINPFAVDTYEFVEPFEYYDKLMLSFEINDKRKRITIQDKSDSRNFAIFVKTNDLISYSLYYFKDNFLNVVKHIYKFRRKEKEVVIIEISDLSYETFCDFDRIIKYDLMNNNCFNIYDYDFIIEKLNEANEMAKKMIFDNMINSNKMVLERTK